MPRQKTYQNPQRSCKIRKRVSSSSSCSSVVRHYRVKRAILVGKRVGSRTPVPTWKVTMASGSRSPVQKMKNYEINGVIRGKEGTSARKLGSTLWEINGLHSHGACEKIDGYKVEGQRRRRSSATSQKHHITEFIPSGEGFVTTAKFGYIQAGEDNSSFETRLKDVNNSLVTSKELVKVLFRVLPHEEQNSSRITLHSALRAELDRSRRQIDRVIQEQQRCNYAEEKARIKEVVSSIGRELETERKLRRQAERLNKKLGVELANSRANLSRATKELEGEKRGKEILEQTCDELAICIEELRREAERVREDVEKERQMLKITDALREERVQMKLTDARYDYEEKNAALEKLKTELEMYFNNQGSSSNKENEDNGGSEEFGESGRSMDKKWSYVVEEPRSDSFDEVFRGRKSLSDKIQWENICLQRTIIRSYSQSPTISTGKSSCLREACNAILLDLASRKANG